MVRGFAGMVKPARASEQEKRTAKGTLLLSDLGLTNVREESGVCRAAPGIMLAGFVQTQLAIHRQPHLRGIIVLLAVVFPPAYRAQAQRIRGLQCLISAAGTTKTGRNGLHVWMDENHAVGFTGSRTLLILSSDAAGSFCSLAPIIQYFAA
jgi:hypothetical protein